jgi:hypothetical protein
MSALPTATGVSFTTPLYGILCAILEFNEQRTVKTSNDCGEKAALEAQSTSGAKVVRIKVKVRVGV